LRGQWQAWLTEYFPELSPRSVRVYMQIARSLPALKAQTAESAVSSIAGALDAITTTDKGTRSPPSYSGEATDTRTGRKVTATYTPPARSGPIPGETWDKAGIRRPAGQDVEPEPEPAAVAETVATPEEPPRPPRLAGVDAAVRLMDALHAQLQRLRSFDLDAHPNGRQIRHQMSVLADDLSNLAGENRAAA
jgi:hypothetical protein